MMTQSQILGTGEDHNEASPAWTVELIKKLEAGLLESTKVIQFLSEIESHQGRELTEDEILMYTQKCENFKRFHNNPNLAAKFIRSLATSNTQREIVLLEEKGRLIEFNKNFKKDIDILTANYSTTLFDTKSSTTSDETLSEESNETSFKEK